MKNGSILVALAGCLSLVTGCGSMCMENASCPTGACMGNGAPGSSGSEKEGVINTAALAAMIQAKTALTILDARAGKYDDGNRIPGAKALAADASAAQAAALIPDKQALVVTYCANLKCPASHMLGERLRLLGYAHVIEYHEGIEGWRAAGQPIEKAAP